MKNEMIKNYLGKKVKVLSTSKFWQEATITYVIKEPKQPQGVFTVGLRMLRPTTK